MDKTVTIKLQFQLYPTTSGASFLNLEVTPDSSGFIPGRTLASVILGALNNSPLQNNGRPLVAKVGLGGIYFSLSQGTFSCNLPEPNIFFFYESGSVIDMKFGDVRHLSPHWISIHSTFPGILAESCWTPSVTIFKVFKLGCVYKCKGVSFLTGADTAMNVTRHDLDDESVSPTVSHSSD